MFISKNNFSKNQPLVVSFVVLLLLLDVLLLEWPKHLPLRILQTLTVKYNGISSELHEEYSRFYIDSINPNLRQKQTSSALFLCLQTKEVDLGPLEV